jgi:hypothetical protein
MCGNRNTTGSAVLWPCLVRLFLFMTTSHITEGLDEKLDLAVTYLQKKHGIKKVDRSVIVNALLDNDTLWTNEALDQLVESVVSQLTSRLMSR